jgi:DNA-directed RNA polymerase specialized sigma24 family protein
VRWGVHRHTVSEHLRRADVQIRFQGLADFQVAEARRLYLAGWSLARLGELFDCDASTVRRALGLGG